MPPQLQLIGVKEVETRKEIEIKKDTAKKEAPIRKFTRIPLIEEEEVIPTKIKAVPKGVRPVIPTHDGCCMKVCTVLNKEVDAIEQALKIRAEELKVVVYGAARIRTRRQIAVLTTRITALKDLRFTLKEKGSCACIEEIKGK